MHKDYRNANATADNLTSVIFVYFFFLLNPYSRFVLLVSPNTVNPFDLM